MNAQSTRGGAYGFKLEVLDKLVDIKSNDGKKNLLMYIVELLEKEKGGEIG
jgi:diaphanous 1